MNSRRAALLLFCSGLPLAPTLARSQDLPDASEPAPADEQSAAPRGAGAVDQPPGEPTAEVDAAPLSAQELEALGFTTSLGSAQVTGLDTELHVSGFLDFSVSKLIASDDSQTRAFFSPHSSFYVGNFNVYLNKNLTESFRMMGEVRFLYEPNGILALETTPGTPTTNTPDHADFQQKFHWGGIEIERVYLDWQLHRFLTARLGQFLTPYGVWNVDHGSPTFIPVQKPYIVGPDLFPERQTGIELFGRWEATNNGTLGYHLTLSNGQGPIAEYRDLDNNKAVGARLFWEQHGLGTLRIGTSAYYGRNTDAQTQIKPTAAGMLDINEKVFYQYDALALAADAVWKYGGLLLQAELIVQQRNYTERGRGTVPSAYTMQPVFPSDSFCWGSYGIVGYRLPWFGIMPYFMGQYFDFTNPSGLLTRISDFSGGLNIRIVDVVVFKLEYSYAFFKADLFGRNDPISFFQGQAAWAF